MIPPVLQMYSDEGNLVKGFEFIVTQMGHERKIQGGRKSSKDNSLPPNVNKHILLQPQIDLTGTEIIFHAHLKQQT